MISLAAAMSFFRRLVSANTASEVGSLTPLLFAFLELLECRPFVDRNMVGLIALDDVLRLLFGSMPLVATEGDLRGHFLLDRSSDQPRFRIPLNVIATSEVSCHWLNLLKSLLTAR